jgi:HEAT repeat protein
VARWLIIAGCSLSLGSALVGTLTVPSAAQEEIFVEPTQPAPPPPTTGTKPKDPPRPSPAPTPSDTPTDTVDQPTKASIRALLKAGKVTDAETDYLAWATYWREDDASLLVSIEREMLFSQFRGGKFSALTTLVQAGDTEALNQVRAIVLSGGQGVAPADLATTIRLVGKRGDRSALNALRLALYHEAPEVVNAAIDALGYMKDRRLIGDLFALYDQADNERSIVLTQALVRLGAARQIRQRFEPQLRFPQASIREKAAVILCTAGHPEGWPIVRGLLTAKTAPYYPRIIATLAALPSPDTQAFVTQALGGKEAEQLAALESYPLLPGAELDQTLLDLFRDEKRPLSVRLRCLDLLVGRRARPVIKDIRTLAISLGNEPIPLKAASLMALPRYYLLDDQPIRESIRQRFTSKETEIAWAARAAMLYYALERMGELSL